VLPLALQADRLHLSRAILSCQPRPSSREAIAIKHQIDACSTVSAQSHDLPHAGRRTRRVIAPFAATLRLPPPHNAAQ
jgi:hypothetical protein